MIGSNRSYLQTPEQWTVFLGALSHELRTPLASLRLLAELLARSSPPAAGSQEESFTANMEEVIQDLLALTGDLSQLAKLMAGEARMRPEKAQLVEVIEDVSHTVRPWAWDRGITILESLDPGLPKHFWTDEARFRQVLTLLIGAAVSQARSSILVFAQGDDERLRIVISSDGPAYSETALQSLFEPLNVDVKAMRRRGGRSLALPLAHQLVLALGGSLEGGNRDGRPTFEIILPGLDSDPSSGP